MPRLTHQENTENHKKSFLIARITLLVATILFCTSAQAVSNQASEAPVTITLVADKWCPYNCDSVSSDQGYMIDIAQAIFSKHNITINYQIIPWSRSVEMVQRGEADALIGASRTDARDLILPKDPIGISINQFYTLNTNKWLFSSMNDLNTMRLGVVSGYAYSKVLDDYINKNRQDPKKLSIVTSNDALEEQVQHLIDGDISTFIENKAVVDYYLMNHPKVQMLRPAGTLPYDTVEDSYLYIAFSPENEQSAYYASLLSEGLKELRASGKLAAIMKRYGLEDWAPSEATK